MAMAMGSNSTSSSALTTNPYYSNFTTNWFTTTPAKGYNDGISITYGVILCACVIIGTSGNLYSFIHFKSKKRNISSSIYMLISANDMVVCMTVVPIALSYMSLSKSKDLMRYIFAHGETVSEYFDRKQNNYRCAVYIFVWETTVRLSVFFTACLSISRTISLFDPFKRQKVKYLVNALLMFVLMQSVETILKYFFVHLRSKFDRWSSNRCVLYISDTNLYNKNAGAFISKISYGIFIVTPAFAVAISSVVSVFALVQARGKTDEKHKVLESSRNRATVTILLFALLYGVCNILLIVDAISRFLPSGKYEKMHEFDEQFFYRNAAIYLLPTVNSAANPIFYFWRMPALRESVKAGIRRILVKHLRG